MTAQPCHVKRRNLPVSGSLSAFRCALRATRLRGLARSRRGPDAGEVDAVVARARVADRAPACTRAARRPRDDEPARATEHTIAASVTRLRVIRTDCSPEKRPRRGTLLTSTTSSTRDSAASTTSSRTAPSGRARREAVRLAGRAGPDGAPGADAARAPLGRLEPRAVHRPEPCARVGQPKALRAKQRIVEQGTPATQAADQRRTIGPEPPIRDLSQSRWPRR